MLSVMEGRSYKATIEIDGNAQMFPMQFFYLNSLPLFNGLYQIMKVRHSIAPNNMNTTAEGIRMRMDFQNGTFAGVEPIVLFAMLMMSLNNCLLGFQWYIAFAPVKIGVSFEAV